MKKLILSLSLVATIVLPALSHAQSSVKDNCDAVTNAAVFGRDQANKRLTDLEKAVQQQASQIRSCMERFSDVASRQAMVIGGFDLAPLRNALMDKACNFLDQQVAGAKQTATNQINSQISQLPAIPSGISDAVQQQTGINPQPKGLWDRLACNVSGNC